MMARQRAWVLAALVVAACARSPTTGPPTAPAASGAGPGSPAAAATTPPPGDPLTPRPPATPLGAGAATCGTLELSAGHRDAPPATTLGELGRAALDGREVPAVDPAEGWLVVAEGPERLALLRELDPGDADAATGTHEVLVVGWFADVDGEGPGWHLEEHGTCRLRWALPEGLGAADLVLDPDHPLDPTALVVHLAAIERECAGGRVATGRLEVVVQELTGDALRLLVGIRPVAGAVTCEGNPATSSTVELDQPLGDRVPVNVSLSPPTPVPAASEYEDLPD